MAWQGSSWQLQVATITLPNGATLEKGIIDHPGSVVLVPMQADQVMMLRQYRLALGQVILELPAGTRHHDESWLDCAQRELREETGFRAGQFIPLGEVWPAPGITNELMAVFLATELTPDPLAADVDEQIEVQSMPLATLLPMTLNGQLQDAKSIVGILRAAAHVGMLPG